MLGFRVEGLVGLVVPDKYISGLHAWRRFRA